MALDKGTGSRRSKSIRRVTGENAGEKARVAVTGRGRGVVDSIIGGEDSQTAAARLAGLGLSAAEKHDLEGYSRARSRQSLAENNVQERIAGEIVGPHIAKLLPGGAPAGDAFDSPAWLALEAAGILPFGRAARGAGKAAEVATKAARPAAAEKIAEVLPEAKKVYRAQEKLRSAEKGRRVAKAAAAMDEGGEAGFQAALRELKGELPKLKFGALEDFDQDAMEELLRHVQQRDDFQFFEKVRTRTALKRMVEEGSAPTPSQRKLLERAFGADTAQQIADSVSFWKKAHDMGVEVLNVPRAMQSTLDFSAPFRQALVLGARHPRMFAREFGPGLKALRSEGAYEELMEGIVARPTYALMERAKLALTGLDDVGNREDAFMSNLAETLTGGRKLSPVRMSSRGYVGFLNKFRADAFDNYLRMAEDAGYDLADEHLLRSIGSWVNHSTGRGSIKALEGAMPALTTVLFSPRLIASRLQLLNPAYYAKLHPFARKQALRGAAQLLGSISLTLYLAKLAGAEVVMDPRSSDFGKIKVGNTRVDIAGGFQQYVVNAYRLVKGETVSSSTGKVTKLEGGFAKPSRADIIANFAGNKLAPGPQYVRGYLSNENFEGDPFEPLPEAGKLLLPIGAQNAREGFQEGVGTGIASTALNTFGFGVLTYGDDKPKGKSRPASKSIRRSGRSSKSLRRH